MTESNQVNSESSPEQSGDDNYLPYSPDAERGILSCVLQNEDLKLIEKIKVDLKEDDIISHVGNKLLLGELLYMNDNGIPIDVVTVSQHLIDKQLLDKIGGPSQLAELLNFVPTSAHYPYYLGILKDKRKLRKTILATDAIRLAVKSTPDDMGYLKGSVLAQTKAIEDCFADEVRDETFTDQLSSTMDEWQQALDGKISSAISSPWATWNEKIGGIRKGLWLIKASRGSGKSSLAMDFCLHTAVDHKEPAEFYTYEMSSQDIIRRAICRLSGVDSKYVFQPDVYKPGESEVRSIARASRILSKAPLRIISKGLDVDGVCYLISKNQPRFAAIDYLQLMPDPKGLPRDASYERKVAENSVRLKRVNVSVGNTIALLAQVNNEGEARHSKGPEDDADLALTITDDGLSICKNRNGEPGACIPVKLKGSTFKFEEDDGF